MFTVEGFILVDRDDGRKADGPRFFAQSMFRHAALLGLLAK
jgi:hypothetical protein